MKNPFKLLFAFATVTPLCADTVYLKNKKEPIVGTLNRIPGDRYEIKSKVQGIIRFHIVKISNVVRITKEDIEDQLFSELMELKVTPDLMKYQWYLEQKEEKIEGFLKDFPRSKYRTDIESLAKAFMKEAENIKNGGIKFKGELISAKERAAQAYTIDSQIALHEFNTLLKKRRFAAAISLAEKMEIDFRGSKVFGEVLDSLPQLVHQYQQSLDLTEKEQKRYLAQEEKAKASKRKAEFKTWMAMRKQQFDTEAAKAKAEMKSGNKWPIINRFDMASIKERMGQLENFRKTIETKKAAYVDLGMGANFTEAWRYIEKKEFAVAKAIIDKLESQQMNIAYLNELEEFFFEQIEDREGFLTPRRGERDIIDLYMGIDESIQDTILEAMEYVKMVVDEESAKECRGRLKVFSMRMKRKLKERASLKKMDPRDMEFQNAELAKSIQPLIEKFEALVKSATKSSKHLDLIKEPMLEFKASLPNPDDFFSENAKRLNAEQEAKVCE